MITVHIGKDFLTNRMILNITSENEIFACELNTENSTSPYPGGSISEEDIKEFRKFLNERDELLNRDKK